MQYDGDYKILKKIWYGHAQPVVTYHHRILPAQGHCNTFYETDSNVGDYNCLCNHWLEATHLC